MVWDVRAALSVFQIIVVQAAVVQAAAGFLAIIVARELENKDIIKL